MTVVEVWMKCCGNIGINFPVESGTKIVLTSCITWFYHLSLGKKVDNLLSKTFFSAWHCPASLKTSSLSWAHCVMCCAKSSGEGDVGCEGTSLRRQIKRRLCGRSPSFPALTFCSCLTCEVCWRCKGRLASPLEEWSAQSPMVVPNFLSFSGCQFLLQCIKEKSESEVAQSCPTSSDPMDCSLPGSSVHGIFQARVLEWSPLPSSPGSAEERLSWNQVATEIQLWAWIFSTRRAERWRNWNWPSP